MSLERINSGETQYTTRFEVSLQELSPNERLVSNILVSAALDMAPIYAQQKNNEFPGANLYPHEAAKEEIEEAARNNPEILSEYTLVRRDQKGKLTVIPYHKAYQKQLINPSQKLKRASQLTTDTNLAEYLSLRSESLVDGNYEKSEREWLNMKNEPTIDIVMGPYDRYLDGLFSRKYAYQSWTGIKDAEKTTEAQSFVDVFTQEYGWDGSPIRARVDKTRAFGGLASDYMWSGNNLPCQQEWREKYGSKFTIFDPSFKKHFQDRLPILNSIWTSSAGESPEQLERVSRLFLFAHEASHPLIRRNGDEYCLKGQYSTVSELYCDSLAIDVSKRLIGKELTEQEWEHMFPSVMSIAVNRFVQLKDHNDASAYLRGEAVLFNFLREGSSVKVQNGRLNISMGKLEENLKDLNQELELLMREGTEKDAEHFINKFGNTESFRLLTK